MPLTEVSGSPGSPWEPPLSGELVVLAVRSELLEGNALGDPATRPLYVYLPPGTSSSAARIPAIYLLQGFTGQLDMWRNRSPFEPTIVERLDRMFAAEELPPAVLVFVDAWTSLGGSQFIDSTATGPYMSYLCDEIVPFVDERFPTMAAREQRAVQGKSSGGYGAMVTSMLRPDVFGAFASHAGDASFESCYLPGIPAAFRALRDSFEGSFEVFFDAFRSAPRLTQAMHDVLNVYAMAACYSPSEDDPIRPEIPFDPATGRIRHDVWERWLRWDPVVMAAGHEEALRSLGAIYLDAGRSDEYLLDVGATAFAAELDRLGVTYSFELFDGGHGGLSHRFPEGMRSLLTALR